MVRWVIVPRMTSPYSRSDVQKLGAPCTSSRIGASTEPHQRMKRRHARGGKRLTMKTFSMLRPYIAMPPIRAPRHWPLLKYPHTYGQRLHGSMGASMGKAASPGIGEVGAVTIERREPTSEELSLYSSE